MNTKKLILLLNLLIIGCASSANCTNPPNTIVGKWKILSVENNQEEMDRKELIFFTIDYTGMNGYIFEFKNNGRFEQNYFEPVLADDQGYDLEWEVNDSTLITYLITNNEKTTFIDGQIKFPNNDQLLLKTKNQTVTFERIK